jgi:hypothetical protein
MRRTVLLGACALLVAAQPGAGSAPRELPLGMPGLPETHTVEDLAPGVTYTRIDRGFASGTEFWFVDVAVVAEQAEAEQVAEDLEASGYDAEVVAIERAPDDPRPGPSGYVVRNGEFATQAEADTRAAELRALGHAGARSAFTAQTGAPTTGPFVVHVLEVDPDEFEGTVEPALATDIVPGRETLTDLAERAGAFAGINASYFVIGEADGTPGDLAGISAVDGELVSEAVNGRTSLLVKPHAGADVAALTTAVRATVDRSNFPVDGLNREPGEIRSCGGVGGDLPTELPRHDFTCTDSDELIVFTEAFGAATVVGAGAEVVVNRMGRIVEVRDARGGAIPPDGMVLSATGAEAAALTEAAEVGDRVRVTTAISEGSRVVPVADDVGVVNGGPRLVAGGRDQITAFAEGFVWLDDPAFFYRFGLFRNPRTIAGVTRDGKLLLVAIDGRNFEFSAGASFEEEAGVMRALGAVEAVNLDGGGSTTVVVDGELVNRPSDPTGERPIGDALLLFE